MTTLSSTGLAEFKDRECLGQQEAGLPSPPGSDREQRDDAGGGVGEQHQGGLRAGFGGAQGGQQAADAGQGERGEAADGGVVSNRAVVSILDWAVAPAASPPAGCW